MTLGENLALSTSTERLVSAERFASTGPRPTSVQQNVAGWLVFGYAPQGFLWLGAGLIRAASMFNIAIEQRRMRAAV